MPPNHEIHTTIQNPNLEAMYVDITSTQSWDERVDKIVHRLSTRFNGDQEHRSQIPLFSETQEINRILPQIPVNDVKRAAIEKSVDESIEYLKTFYSVGDITPDNVGQKLEEVITSIRKEYKGKDVEYFVDFARRLMTKRAYDPTADVDPAGREKKANIVNLKSLVKDAKDPELKAELSKILGKYALRDISSLDKKDIAKDIATVEEAFGVKAFMDGEDDADLEALSLTLGFLYTTEEEKQFLSKPENDRTFNLTTEVEKTQKQPKINLKDLYPGIKDADEAQKVLRKVTLDYLTGNESDEEIMVEGRIACWSDHLDKLNKLYGELSNETATNKFLGTLKKRISQLNGDSREQVIDEYLTDIKNHSFVGKKPEWIGPGVDYLQVKAFLYSASGQSKRRVQEMRGNVEEVQNLLRERIQDAMAQGGTPGEGALPEISAPGGAGKAFDIAGRGLEQYFFVAELQERMDYINKLDYDARKKALSLLLGETMRTEGSAQVLQMLLRAWLSDPSTGTFEGQLKAGFNFVRAIEQGTTGYKSFEEFYKAVGYIKPEQRAAIYSAGIDGKFRMKVTNNDDTVLYEEKEYSFELSVSDFVAAVYDPQIIPELLVAREAPPEEGSPEDREFKRKFNEQGVYDASLAGHTKNVGKWLAYSILFKMGFLKEEAKYMAENYSVNGILQDRDGNRYDTLWTDRINVITLKSIDDFGLWLGTNWWVGQAGENLLLGDRTSYLFANGGEDFRRREAYGWRKIEDRSGYFNQAGRFLPGERVLNGPQFLPPIDMASAKSALTDPLLKIVKTSGNEDIDNKRERDIKRLTEARMIPPEYATEMGRMVLGLDDYAPIGGSAEEKTKQICQKIDDFIKKYTDPKDFSRFVPFGAWKYSGINPDTPEFEQAWGGFEFQPLLEMEGLTDIHFEKLRNQNPNVTVGKSGWNLFVEYANSGLLQRETLDIQQPDSLTRYNQHKEAALEAINTFLEQARFSIQARGVERIPILGRGEMEEDVNARFAEWRNKLSGKDIVYPDMSSFITNSYQEVKRNLSVLRCFTQAHGAWSLDTYVSKVSFKELAERGVFVEEKVTWGEFRHRWADLGLNNDQVMRVRHKLESHGFFFNCSSELRAQKGDDAQYLHGPHFSYVPSVVCAKDLLESIGNFPEATLDFRQRAKTLLDKQFFSWEFLIRKGAALGASMIEAITTSKTSTDKNADLDTQFEQELIELVRSGKLAQDIIVPNVSTRIHIIDPEDRGLASEYRVYSQAKGINPHAWNYAVTRWQV